MSYRPFIIRAVTAAVLVAAPRAAHAQSWTAVHPAADLAGGYASLTDSATHDTLAHGWFASGSMVIHRRLSAVLEAGGAYKHVQDGLFGRDERVHAFMAGARLSGRPIRERLTPFAQLLAGSGCYCGSTDEPDGFRVGFAVQAGAGLDWRLAGALGVRVAGDVRNVRDAGLSFHQWRLAIGPVIQVGTR